MEADIGEMLSTADELKAPVEELKEQLADTMMLGNLPEAYEMLISALEVRPENELKILGVKEKLIQEHQRRYTHHSVERNQCSLWTNTEDVILPSLQDIGTAIHNQRNNNSAATANIEILIICPIPNKEDKKDYANYRSISRLSISYMIIVSI
uniref:Uncharacterized protein n=1 Tax=Megaselia scalaris TaxID=36166 RepID=T1GDS6_MEGSC